MGGPPLLGGRLLEYISHSPPLTYPCPFASSQLKILRGRAGGRCPNIQEPRPRQVLPPPNGPHNVAALLPLEGSSISRPSAATMHIELGPPAVLVSNDMARLGGIVSFGQSQQANNRFPVWYPSRNQYT